MIFNFMPYLYLFCLYNQYENAIGGLFKPFSVIISMGLIINFLHGKLKKMLEVFYFKYKHDFIFDGIIYNW